jgi:hypothetical protein
MAEPIMSPVELGFSEFVSKLIADTFEAILSSTYSQEENWDKIRELLSHDLETFTDLTIDDETLYAEIVRLFPGEEEGTSIVKDEQYRTADPARNITEKPPIEYYTGFQPKRNKLSEKDVNEIYRIVRNQLGQKHYEILSTVLSKGTTKVIVDAGKISAKLNFEIYQTAETDNNSSAVSAAEIPREKIIIKQKLPIFGGLSKPVELRNVHFLVKPPNDSTPQSSQIKANVYSEVEIQFKTVS